MTDKIRTETGWVLSTAHMTQQDHMALSSLCGNGQVDAGCLHITEYDNGFLLTLWVTQECLDEDDVDAYGEFANANQLSVALFNRIKDAVAADCRYLRFDRDGDKYEHLTQFEW